MSRKKLEVITGIYPDDFSSEVNEFTGDANIEIKSTEYSTVYRGEARGQTVMYVAFIEYEEVEEGLME